MSATRKYYVKPLKKIQRNYKINASLFQAKVPSKTKRVLQYMTLCRTTPMPSADPTTRPFSCTRFTEAYVYNQGVYTQLRKKCNRQEFSLLEMLPLDKLSIGRSSHSNKFMQSMKLGIRREDERMDELKGRRRPQTAVKYQPRRYQQLKLEHQPPHRPESSKLFCQGVTVMPVYSPRPVSRHSEAVDQPRRIEYIDEI